MDKFIEKMEALLEEKECLFKGILLLLTVVGLFFFFCSPCYWFFSPESVIAVYVTAWAWMLFAAWILRLIVLGTNEEKKQDKSDLDDFLEFWGKEPFDRHDFAKFKYGTEILSSSSKYKNLWNTLRNALKEGKIKPAEKDDNKKNAKNNLSKNRLMYKKV